MKKFFSLANILVRGTWKFFRTTVTLTTNLIFLFFFIMVLVALFYRPQVSIPDGTALLIQPMGDIVEHPSALGPINRFINNLAGVPVQDETLLQDLQDGINAAAKDDRIQLLVLDTSSMDRAGLNQLQVIGHTLQRFKETGKKVIAVGDRFSQSQYYLSSWADEIYLHPMGAVSLRGFGIFRLYLRELLDNLDIDVHIFRVGTYKSALEPLTRNNMSSAAKGSNQYWLKQLWNIYCTDIASQRGLTVAAINESINTQNELMRSAEGDAAQTALRTGLIDGLKTHQEFDDYLASFVGRDKNREEYQHVTLDEYLTTITPSYQNSAVPDEKIALIVAQGNIVYGHGSVGQIGSSALAEKIRSARQDSKVKAIVLRIDTGGGSAFASEIIRQELRLAKTSGKPVVISMGTMAASGGYWLAADADVIVASPLTLTGSIGIFGAVPTFEKSLSRIGVTSDGIGTTSMAGGIDPTRGLSMEEKEILQLGVENGYRKFITLVAEGRNLPIEAVKKIAEGRVWDGATALNLGLVDKLGSLDVAIAEAARLADIPADRAVYLEAGGSPLQQFLRQLNSQSADTDTLAERVKISIAPLWRSIHDQFDFLLEQQDPGHLYAHSLLPLFPTEDR